MAESDTVPCPTCGRAVSLSAGECPYDGTPVDSATAIAVASTINPSLKNIEAPGDVDELIVGERFGKYVVEELIGRGGMGTVYRVSHAELGNKFALKVMDPRIVSSTDAHTRFLREARAAARIDHPNVIRVLDHARHPRFGSYLVMELLSGTSLDKILAAEKTLAEPRAIALATQICDALGAAHDGGIVHRDLKPANVFIVRVRGEEVVKVMDFGVAKVVTDVATLLTRPGTVIGTPFYMSPEQWDNADLDARSDIYSFGVLLYEMVTGRVPIRGSGITEVAKNLATVKPTPPRLLRKDLSQAVEAIILRCLEKKAADRYASMRDVAEALDRARTEPGVVEPSAARTNVRRIGSTVLGLVGVGLALYGLQHTRTNDKPAALTAEAPSDAAQGPAPTASALLVLATPSSSGSPPFAASAAASAADAAPAASAVATVGVGVPRAASAAPGAARAPAASGVSAVPPSRRPAVPRPPSSQDELFGE